MLFCGRLHEREREHHTMSSSTDMGDGIAASVLAGEGLLAADDIPDENQTLSCFSCGETLVGLHCHGCGQKNDDYRRSIFSLFGETLASLLSFESRIWKTWLSLLFRPGRAARGFANGRRTVWTSPVRAYLAISILLFGYIAFTGTQIVAFTVDVERVEGNTTALESLKPSDLRVFPDIHFFETNKRLATHQTGDDALRNFLLAYPAPLELRWNDGVMQLIEAGKKTPETASLETGTFDSLGDAFRTEEQKSDLDADSSTIVINGETLDATKRTQAMRALRLVIQRPEAFNNIFSTYLPRVMFFMMPFTMLLGALFIRGRGNALLYDHLVHTAYIHAVFFFWLLASLILTQWTPVPGSLLLLIMGTYLFIYLPMSLKHMFSRGVIKTLWTSYAVGFIYLLALIIILTWLTVISFESVMDQATILGR